MQLDRRVSATFKDLPGGQVLGPTYDYTQRLLNFSLLASEKDFTTYASHQQSPDNTPNTAPQPITPINSTKVIELLNQENLIEKHPVPEGDPAPNDLTRQPVKFPADRPTRLQNLARGDEGFCYRWRTPHRGVMHIAIHS